MDLDLGGDRRRGRDQFIRDGTTILDREIAARDLRALGCRAAPGLLDDDVLAGSDRRRGAGEDETAECEQKSAHGDYVWETGKFTNPPQKDLETWFVRGGSAGAALYTFREPGVYAYVNHNLIEAVELGATAHIKVEGKWNDDLMKQISPPGPISPDKLGAAEPASPVVMR